MKKKESIGFYLYGTYSIVIMTAVLIRSFMGRDIPAYNISYMFFICISYFCMELIRTSWKRNKILDEFLFSYLDYLTGSSSKEEDYEGTHHLR